MMKMTEQQRLNALVAPDHFTWAGPSQKREDWRLRFDAKNYPREASNSFLYLQVFTRTILCRMPHAVSQATKRVALATVITRLNPTRHPVPFPALPEPPLLAIIIRLWPCNGAVG
jgi:hypothetical protein